jgi:type I restriction enzyme S subunit
VGINFYPADWNVYIIRQLYDFKKTASYSRDQLNESGSIAYIHYGDIHTKFGYKLDLKKALLPKISTEMSSNYTKIQTGDLVLADASEDYSGVAKMVEIVNDGHIDAISGLHTLLLRPKTDLVRQGFGTLIQCMPVFREQIIRYAAGLKVYGISKSNLALIEIPLPPIDEQKVIAEALSDLDELIETLKQEIDKKLTLLRALSQELLPWNFLTSLPSGWSLVTLGDSGIISGAGVDKVFRADEKEVTLINYMDVYRNDGLSKEFNYSKTTATAKQISNCSLKEKDVLFTPTSETPEDIARSSVIINDIPNAVYSYHLIRFRPLQQFDLNFLKHVFNIDDFRSQVRKSAEGSGTRYVITLPRFRRLMMPVPDLAIQSSIGSILDEASTEIKKLKIELGKYEWLKQGMMNDLLTGKVRLV